MTAPKPEGEDYKGLAPMLCRPTAIDYELGKTFTQRASDVMRCNQANVSLCVCHLLVAWNKRSLMSTRLKPLKRDISSHR